jgi:hypothetical protein
MSMSSILNYTKSNNLQGPSNGAQKSAASAATAAATATASSVPTSGFGDVLARSSQITNPNKTVSADSLVGTVQSTTIQTSGYVFDPLGVVGIVPESNTFLQAIRQMMGKPLGSPAREATAPPTPPTPPTAAAPTPATTTAAVTSSWALPAAASALPTPAASTASTKPGTGPSLTAGAASTQADTTSVADSMSSIEAQLNYLGRGTEASAPAAQAATVASVVEAATVAAQAAVSGDLVDQYLAATSAAASAKAQSDLASAIGKEA